MSYRGEICRVLDKYKSGKWDRDKAAAQLEKYFKEHIVWPDDETLRVADEWLTPPTNNNKGAALGPQKGKDNA